MNRGSHVLFSYSTSNAEHVSVWEQLEQKQKTACQLCRRPIPCCLLSLFWSMRIICFVWLDMQTLSMSQNMTHPSIWLSSNPERPVLQFREAIKEAQQEFQSILSRPFITHSLVFCAITVRPTHKGRTLQKDDVCNLQTQLTFTSGIGRQEVPFTAKELLQACSVQFDNFCFHVNGMSVIKQDPVLCSYGGVDAAQIQSCNLVKARHLCPGIRISLQCCSIEGRVIRPQLTQKASC